MSAVNILTDKSRALIFTDAAVYDGDGILLALAEKVHRAGSVVVTGRGNAFFPQTVAGEILARAWAIDEVIADHGSLLEQCFSAALPMMRRAGKVNNDLWIVGWSDRVGGPQVAQWSNCAPEDVPRFSTVRHAMAPDLDDSEMAALRVEIGPISREAVDLSRLGASIMRRQRYSKGVAEFGCEGQFLVGGHILETEVSKVGIRSRIVHRWDEDRICERIRPLPQISSDRHPNVTPIGAGGRAARRRLDRELRKGVA